MSRNSAGRRGHGVIRDTINTSIESFDGVMFALSMGSKKLWRWRLVRAGLAEAMLHPDLLNSPPPSLWRERSVKLAHALLLGTLVVSWVLGSSLVVYAAPLVTYGMFLWLESSNTALEWLIDSYQAQLGDAKEPDAFVRMVKHVASGPVLVINFVGGLVWLLLLLRK